MKTYFEKSKKSIILFILAGGFVATLRYYPRQGLTDHNLKSETFEPTIQSAEATVESSVTKLSAQRRDEAPGKSHSPSRTSEGLAAILREIFEKDDYCGLERLQTQYSESHPLKKDRRYFSYEILMALFDSTAFSSHYLSYEVARLGGDDPTGYRFGRFTAALANARWLQPETDETSTAKPREAYRLMMLLVHDDPENAAPAAFALAMADTFNGKDGFEFRETERDELLSSLENATRFDTYMMSYLREMASLDDPRATAYLLRVGHLATLALPDWSLFQAGFKNATSDDPRLRLKVTDLMMAEAKNARRPSTALSYNVLETAVARALAGKSRAYPTFQDIDRGFLTDDKVEATLFEKALRHSSSDPCTPQYVENVRAYVQHLKDHEMALGVSM